MNEELESNLIEVGYKYIVYGDGLGDRIGYANNFGECRKIHKEWLEKTNHPQKDSYAGLACDGGYLRSGMAFPAFYVEE